MEEEMKALHLYNKRGLCWPLQTVHYKCGRQLQEHLRQARFWPVAINEWTNGEGEKVVMYPESPDDMKVLRTNQRILWGGS